MNLILGVSGVNELVRVFSKLVLIYWDVLKIPPKNVGLQRKKRKENVHSEKCIANVRGHRSELPDRLETDR